MLVNLEPFTLSESTGDKCIASKLAIYLSPEPRLVYVRRMTLPDPTKEGGSKLTSVISISNGTGKELLTQSPENLYELPPFLEISQTGFLTPGNNNDTAR